MPISSASSSASSLEDRLASEESKLLACVHCGLCLEACPTYTFSNDENDSPRGRIYLMRAVVEEKLLFDSGTFRTHIDRCLGCRACEPVCPAGVEYGQLLEASRATLYAKSHRTLSYRTLHWLLRNVWLHPARLRFAFALARVFRTSGLALLLFKSRLLELLSKRMQFCLGLLVSSAPQLNTDQHQTRAARISSDQKVAAMLFSGCVTGGLFDRVNAATRRVLNVNNVETSIPEGQVCCGALHAHAGDLDGARALARQNIAAFDIDDVPVVTNAGGCGAMLVSYAHLLADDPLFAERAGKFSNKVRDVSQVLGSSRIKSGAFVDGVITYDASCHLLNGQHATEAPLKMLRAIPDLKFVTLEGAERCCGGAGVYNLLEPEMSAGVLEEKLKHIHNSGATVVTTGNPGCQMQIGAGALVAKMNVTICHPVELLDESYRQAGFYPESS